MLQLRGVRYTWNTLGVAHGGTVGTEQVGLLAQEWKKSTLS
ncbi:tail fiber domain-containing protein [Hymenobacter volaticus]|uniref:Tail fiber domain-containing protein n=1 Tax=Hymenobacter volaticus TaxID=2932254 RepID=A0ABY4GEQ9_9BACT|nr:tail fiber domain-containing protein [Hymenobacter volaticus]UOQ69296.1 tail fiber domain-containing protein [Hymenobacter volaticus]